MRMQLLSLELFKNFALVDLRYLFRFRNLQKYYLS